MEEGNWSNSTLAQMRDVSLPGRILSPVCLLVIIVILLLLIFYKTYNSTLQRLFLYLTIVTVIQETCLTVGYATQFEYSGHKKICDAMFIFWQWSNTVGYLLTLAMIVFLPYKIYEQLKGDPFPRLSRSRYLRVALECLFIFIVLVLPLTYILPFIILAFANCGFFLLHSQLCRVSLTNILVDITLGNCTIHQLIISVLAPGYIVGFIDLIGTFVITIALSVVFCRLAREYRETRITLRRTITLLGFFVVYTIILIAFTGVILGIMTKVDNLSELLEVNVAILPVFQLIFPLIFLFYLYSFNLCRWRAIKRAAAEWRCFRSCCERENAPREAATAPGSHHVMVPSVTVFNEPHSRVTTDNEEQDFYQLVVAEDMAL